MKNQCKILAIGDPHIKKNNLNQIELYINNIKKIVKEHSPDFVVILGDTLDTHEVAHVQPFKYLCKLIEKISSLTKLFVIMGNHDYIDHTQFLTDNHFFIPFKKWENVVIVDKPHYYTVNGKEFVFCPYVEPGRFEEALNTLEKDNIWEMVDCIFAHQEFKGCKMGAITSTNGDKWDEDYPPVISGHIHDEQVVKNVFYVGSSIQHSFAENANKKVWLVTFADDKSPKNGYFLLKKIDLGMKRKRIVYVDVSDVEKFNFKKHENEEVKLTIKGHKDELNIFRKSDVYKKMQKAGIKFSYNSVKNENETPERIENINKKTSYVDILESLVEEKSESVQQIYKKLTSSKGIKFED